MLVIPSPGFIVVVVEELVLEEVDVEVLVLDVVVLDKELDEELLVE